MKMCEDTYMRFCIKLVRVQSGSHAQLTYYIYAQLTYYIYAQLTYYMY
jgi:hypothetical protein